MELKTFAEMFKDRNALDFTKLKSAFGEINLAEYLDTLYESFYYKLPLLDLKDRPVVVLPAKINIPSRRMKTLALFYSKEASGIRVVEDEMIHALLLEQTVSSRECVRRTLNSKVPVDEHEKMVSAFKRGLDFISVTANKITEENLCRLYRLLVSDFLAQEDEMFPEIRYRHTIAAVAADMKSNEDAEIMPAAQAQGIQCQGIDPEKLPGYMAMLMDYVQIDDGLDPLVKSIVIYYYYAYLKPYFKGNNIMAGLLQLWYLIQIGYTTALNIPLFTLINESKADYDQADSLIKENYRAAKIMDLTPFVRYFLDNVFVNPGKKLNGLR